MVSLKNCRPRRSRPYCCLKTVSLFRASWRVAPPCRRSGPSFAPAEDYDLWARLAAGSNLFIIPLNLTSYRTHCCWSERARTGTDAHRGRCDPRRAARPPRRGAIAGSCADRRVATPPYQWSTGGVGTVAVPLGRANDRAAVYPRAVFQTGPGQTMVPHLPGFLAARAGRSGGSFTARDWPRLRSSSRSNYSAASVPRIFRP